MPQQIEVPGMGVVEFPDGMSDDQIAQAIRSNMPAQRQTPNTGAMAINSANKAIAAIPDAILNTPNRLLNLGKAAYGTAATALGRPDLAPEMTEDPNYVRSLFDKAGLTNNALEPATPSQRVLDTAIQGGVSGLASPAAGLRQVATNLALGGIAGGAAGATKEATGNDALSIAAGMATVPLGAKAISSAKQKIADTALRQQQNAVRDATIADARNAGYVVSPSETNPGVLNQTLEGIAGKLSTRQLASQRNQDVTNRLARKELGIPQDVPMTPELLASMRNEAYNTGYAPIAQSGEIRPGRAYRQALDNISAQYTGASSSFPAAVKDDVNSMVDALRVRKFDAGDAIKMAQILRDDAAKSYASGDKGLGKAQRAAANAIEDQIELGLQGKGKSGSEMLDQFREARKQIAKTHTIESALFEGTGNVQASKLAAALQKGRPLSGDIETIARTAQSFPKNMQSPETIGAVPAISPLDVFSGAGLGIGGAALTGPYGAVLGAAPSIVRPLARKLLLSDMYQNAMVQPKYKNSAIARFLSHGDSSNPTANAAMLSQILANEK